MSKYEIIVTLFTIVYGLMLTDLFASLHRLLRAGKKVAWNWLSPAAAWYLLLLILKNWWDLALPEKELEVYSILTFLVYGHMLVLLYLSVSAVLPDKVGSEGVSLKKYYFGYHRYFWGLMAAVIIFALGIRLLQDHLQGVPLNATNLIANGIVILLTLLLAISRKYLLHAVILILFIAVTLLEIIQKI